MAISLREKLVALNEAPRHFSGRRPHLSSVRRWAGPRGVRGGIRLETLVIGGRVFTSEEAIERFVAATTAAANGDPPPMRTPKQRQQAIERAEADLGLNSGDDRVDGVDDAQTYGEVTETHA